MSLGFFIIGGIIFTCYVFLLIWSIIYNNKKQQEENYPNYNGMGDTIDYDGMGNFSRIPTERQKKRQRVRSQKVHRKTNQRV